MNLCLTDSAAVPYSRRVKTLSFLAAVAWLAAAPGWAQPAAAPGPLGNVGEAKGLVTMSLGSRVSTVQPGTPIFDHARFVTSSSGSVRLDLSNGCEVKLQPNQMVTIDDSSSCDQQIAAIMFLSTDTAGAGALLRVGLPLLGAAALAGAVSRGGNIAEGEISVRPR